MKKQLLLIGITFSSLLISSILVSNTSSAASPIAATSIQMKRDEVNKTLTVEKINYGEGEIVEFRGNASYPLPPLEIGDKITNCTGTISAINTDANALSGTWDFSGETDFTIVSSNYTIKNPQSESKKTPGFELIPLIIAIALVLFWQRKRI